MDLLIFSVDLNKWRKQMSHSWTAQTWISLLGALISVLGALVSWRMSTRKFQWDASKDLTPFRIKTLEILRQTENTTNNSDFLSTYQEWNSKFEEVAPLLSNRGRQFSAKVALVTSGRYMESHLPPKIKSRLGTDPKVCEAASTLKRELQADPYILMR